MVLLQSSLSPKGPAHKDMNRKLQTHCQLNQASPEPPMNIKQNLMHQ